MEMLSSTKTSPKSPTLMKDCAKATPKASTESPLTSPKARRRAGNRKPLPGGLNPKVQRNLGFHVKSLTARKSRPRRKDCKKRKRLNTTRKQKTTRRKKSQSSTNQPLPTRKNPWKPERTARISRLIEVCLGRAKKRKREQSCGRQGQWHRH